MDMTEYLVLMKLNPAKIAESLGAIRNMETKGNSGVDLRYSMNIFGTWDVGVWIDAEGSKDALSFVQKKIKDLSGVTEVYTIPTFPHKNTIGIKKGSEEKQVKVEE